MGSLKQFFAGFLQPGGLQSLLLALVGIPIAVAISWWFYVPPSSGSLSHNYSISMIYDAKSARQFGELQAGSPYSFSTAPLILSDGRNQVIKTNVYSADIKLWNSGNANISGNDINQPYRIVFSDTTVKILRASMEYETSNNAEQFVFDTSNLSLSWKNFDPREGVRINILYSADRESPAHLDGFVSNILPRSIELTDLATTFEIVDLKFVRRCLIFYVAICLTLVTMLTIFSKSHRSAQAFWGSNLTVSSVTIFGVLGLLEVVRYAGVSAFTAAPPF